MKEKGKKVSYSAIALRNKGSCHFLHCRENARLARVSCSSQDGQPRSWTLFKEGILTGLASSCWPAPFYSSEHKGPSATCWPSKH